MFEDAHVLVFDDLDDSLTDDTRVFSEKFKPANSLAQNLISDHSRKRNSENKNQMDFWEGDKII